MHKISKRNWIHLLALTIIFLLAAILVYKTTIVTRIVMPNTHTLVRADADVYYAILSGDHIEQRFIYPSDELLSAGVEISIDDDMVNHLVANEEDRDLGTLHLDICDENGSSIMHADYEVYTLRDGQKLVASFLDGKQNGWQGRKLNIVLDAENIREDVELSIGYTEALKEDTALSINGEEKNFTLNVQTADYQFGYWKLWAAFGAGMIYILLVGTYLALAVFKMKPENVFLFTGFGLAILYLLLIPPMTVPDEESHYRKAYSYTNQLIGEMPKEEGNIVIDVEDLEALSLFEAKPSLSEYDKLKKAVFKSGREEGSKEIALYDTQAKAITYLPGMIGIVLGRLLGLNGVMVIILGRLVAIGFYLAAMYWFIRLMPFGKAAAFIVSILPMTIQQCCSYSYDAVVIEIAFLYLAVLFNLMYKDKPIQKYQIVLYVIFMIILSISKGGTYMPLCLLTMMIPVSRFKDTKRKWIFVGTMAAIAIASFLISTLSYVLYVASPEAQAEAGAYLAGESYGVAGLLGNPMLFITLMLRTLFLSGDGYLETMLGMQLGWLNIFVSRIAIYGFLLLMILCVLHVEKKKSGEAVDPEITVGQKIFYLVAFSFSIIMAFAAMFMSWTPQEANTIEGIQGRYFLPFLPSLLLIFRSKWIILKRNVDKVCMFVAVCLQCVAIYGILLSLERVI